MTQRLTYLSNARRTTSETVSPLASALAKAASHKSSGMRIARGVVSPMSTPAGHGWNLRHNLDLQAQPRPGAVGKCRHWMAFGPSHDRSLDTLAGFGRVQHLQAHPGIAVLRRCGGHTAAYVLNLGTHTPPSCCARIYTLGASVYTRQPLWPHSSQGPVAA